MTPGIANAVFEGRDELTEEETDEYVESETMRVYGLSVADFIAAAEAGNLTPGPALAHLVLLTGARTDSC